MSGRSFGGRRVGREEVPVLVEAFLSDLGLASIPKQISGSYFRGLTECDGIDLVLIADESQQPEVKNAIKKAFGRRKAKNEPKMFGIYDGVLFDLHIVDLDNLGPMMLHTIGSWQFNKLMRTMAMAQGWILNKHGLLDLRSKRPLLKSSDEVPYFHILKMPYIDAQDRSQGCEFELKSLTDPDRMCKYRLVEDGWEVVG